MAAMKGFYRPAGVLSILSGALGIAGYIVYLLGVRSLFLAMPVSPMEVIDIYSRPFVRASVFINAVSILFAFPAVVGMALVLWERSRALTLHGLIAGILGFLCLLIQNTLEAGVISVVMGHEACATGVSRESFSVIVYNTAQFFMFPALILTGAFYLLFGLGFRKFSGLPRWTSVAFLAEVVFFLLTLVFFLAQKEIPANMGVLAQVVATGTAFVLAGIVMLRRE